MTNYKVLAKTTFCPKGFLTAKSFETKKEALAYAESLSDSFPHDFFTPVKIKDGAF